MSQSGPGVNSSLQVAHTPPHQVHVAVGLLQFVQQQRVQSRGRRTLFVRERTPPQQPVENLGDVTTAVFQVYLPGIEDGT